MRRPELDSRDAALATQLCFGVLQNQMLLDFYLSKFSNIPLKRMEGKVVQALRLGAYQMLFLDRIPHSAAVNRAVSLTQTHCKNPRAAGMVNGILRSLERSLEHLPAIPQGDPVAYLSILYSHPAWLVKEFSCHLGTEEAAQLLAADNSQPPTTVMVNTTRIHAGGAERLLEAASGGASPIPGWRTACCPAPAIWSGWRPFSRGCSMSRTPPPAWRCWPPGQAGHAGAGLLRRPRGQVLCRGHRHGRPGGGRLLRPAPPQKEADPGGADRLGLTCITPMTADGKVFRPEWEGAFDLVLVDAPCSGLGVIRKKPDIRYKDPEPLADLPAGAAGHPAQRRPLREAGRDAAVLHLHPAGRENERGGGAFSGGEQHFRPEAFPFPGPVWTAGRMRDPVAPPPRDGRLLYLQA